MPKMVNPQGEEHDIKPAGVEALKSLGWGLADEAATKAPAPKPRGRKAGSPRSD